MEQDRATSINTFFPIGCFVIIVTSIVGAMVQYDYIQEQFCEIDKEVAQMRIALGDTVTEQERKCKETTRTYIYWK